MNHPLRLAIAFCVAFACVALAPSAAASPPTCSVEGQPGGHALVDDATCVAACLRGQSPEYWLIDQFAEFRCVAQ